MLVYLYTARTSVLNVSVLLPESQGSKRHDIVTPGTPETTLHRKQAAEAGEPSSNEIYGYLERDAPRRVLAPSVEPRTRRGRNQERSLLLTSRRNTELGKRVQRVQKPRVL